MPSAVAGASALQTANLRQLWEDERRRARAADSPSALPTHAALANGCFLSVTLNYRRWLIDTHKDYKHAKSRIEAFRALDRDIETLTYPLYEELIAEASGLSPETQRDYVNMLLTMLNRAKAQRIIPRPYYRRAGAPGRS